MVNSHHNKTDRLDDNSERAAGQAAARLQRAVLKLAFSFYGQNPELDDRLKRLGALIKSGRKDGTVQVLIDEVVDVIVAKDVRQSSNEYAAQKLAELLDRLATDGAAADQARALQRRLCACKEKEELERYGNEAAALINTLLRHSRSLESESRRAPSDPELLQILLGRLRPPDSVREPLDALRQRIERHKSQAALIEIAEEAAALISAALHEVRSAPPPPQDITLAKAQLQRLANELNVPTKLAKEMNRVKAQLDQAVEPKDLGQSVQALAELFAKLRAQLENEVNELGGFLGAISRRLEEFRANVTQVGEVQTESLESTAAFHRMMNRQVAGMRDKVDDETDIDRLKLVVVSELEGLESGLSSYVATEETRHSGARGTLEVMLNRLNDLEVETHKLREDLDEQHALSLLDPLTGVFNRLGYNEGMNREFSRWRRYGGALSLVVLDLDHFKAINDQFGHAAGDKVLTSVATLIRKQIRSCDVFCRFGGEEFVLILPETSLAGAVTAAEKLRVSVATSQFRFKDLPVPVAISIGVAEFREATSVEEVFERADKALYLAKNSGRNRVCSEQDIAPESQSLPQGAEQVTIVEPLRPFA